MWAMGGTGRIAITAITAAFSGNVTGSGAELVKATTVNTLQALGAQQIKQLADQLGGEGSAAHTALHAVLACAGAAATSGNCTTAALASSSGVVINTLLDSLEGTNSNNLTAAEKEARAHLIETLVTSVTASLGGNAAVANTAARIETENNALILIPIALELIDKGITAYDAWELQKAVEEGRTDDAAEIAAGIAIGAATEIVPANKVLQKIATALGKNSDTIVKGAEEIVEASSAGKIHINASTGLKEVDIPSTPLEGQARLNTPDTGGSGKYKPTEAAIGAQLESVLGKMERYTPPAGMSTPKAPDFVITEGVNAGKTVDAMYTTDNLTQKEIDGLNKFYEKNMADGGKGIKVIQDHLNKADFVPVDFRVLTSTNQKIFLDYVKTLPASQQAQIIIVR